MQAGPPPQSPVDPQTRAAGEPPSAKIIYLDARWPGASMPRTILHADLDAFYAAVEQRDDPNLAGKPVVVGGSPEDRGVVAAASYEARRFGIRSAMSMRTAVRLCPQAVRVPPRFGVYGAVSGDVHAVFREFTALIEPVALDEAYLDVSEAVAGGAEPAALAQALKQRVREAVRLTISVGVAGNKSAAKIASDLGKPDGLVVVPPGGERAFLAPLPVGRLWGVGPKSQERLRRFGVETIGQLAELDRRILAQLFGRWGDAMGELARGSDDRPVSAREEVKQVSRETTFASDVSDRAVLHDELRELCEGVGERLQRRSLRGRTVTIKLRRHDFATRTRQATLPAPVQTGSEVFAAARRILDAELAPGERLRLLGVGVSGFADNAQLPLFSLDDPLD
ncbi:MAG TPA: DNA polymerase IV [Dehalococcoidia bacterium]|nr:DNA polymerase IV [Dehalococcoidia bacterium]